MNDDVDDATRRVQHVPLRPPMPHFELWKQHALPTVYSAVPSEGCVVAGLFTACIVCVALAIATGVASDAIVALEVRYDDVNFYSLRGLAAGSALREYTAENSSLRQGQAAVVNFTVPKTLKAPVVMRYKLTGFYQNVRRYNEGASEEQLLGRTVLKNDLFMCAPLRSPGELQRRSDEALVAGGGTYALSELVYSPCGVKPWSMFNDSAVLSRLDPNNTVAPRLVCNTSDFGPTGTPLGGSRAPNYCRKAGIAWAIDTERFKPPSETPPTLWWRHYTHSTSNAFLRRGWYDRELGHSLPDATDVDLQIWVRAAPTPSFSKVWRVIEEDMPALDASGTAITYQLNVSEFFDTASFRGLKAVTFTAGGTAFMPRSNKLLVGAFAAIAAVTFVFFIATLSLCLLRTCTATGHKPAASRGPIAFSPTPSHTLEQSLRADSYEAGLYTSLAAQRQLRRAQQYTIASDYAGRMEAEDLSVRLDDVPPPAAHAIIDAPLPPPVGPVET